MGILDQFFKGSSPKPIDSRLSEKSFINNLMSKVPNFNVTNFTRNNYFTNPIDESTSYYDQYRLYVYKSIDYISDKVAATEVFLVDQEEQIQEDNPIFSDLQFFNPYMNLYEARKLKETHLRLTGAAFWYIDRDPQENKIFELYPLDPTKMDLKTNNIGLPDYYQYRDSDGNLVRLEQKDVIYFRRQDPQNWFKGQSQIRNIQTLTNGYIQGSRYNMNSLANGGANLFWVFEGLNNNDKKKLEYQLRNKYEGARNAGRQGILTFKPEIVEVGKSQKDLDYIEGMKMMRSDILAMFGIPEALMFPSATNSNSKEARTIFQSDTLDPALKQEQSSLNEQLLKKLEGTRKGSLSKIYTFIYDPVVTQDSTMLVDEAVKLTQAGIITRNEALEYIGLESVEEGDVYINSSLSVPQDSIEDNLKDEKDEKVEELEKRAKNLEDSLNKLVEEKQEKDFIAKNIRLVETQEGILIRATKALFVDQFERTIDYINNNKPQVRNVFDLKSENELAFNVFEEPFIKVAQNTNDFGNVEIKQKLFKVGSKNYKNYKIKTLTPEILNAIEKRTQIFANEINKTTQQKLRDVIANGLENGFDKTQYRSQVRDVFNSYIDGSKNVDTLEKMGLYVPEADIDINGKVIRSSENRYNKMLEQITKAQQAEQITQKQYEEALKALDNIARDSASPIAKTVVEFIENTLGIKPTNKELSRTRANLISRTEATYIRNLSFQDTYTDNPFVVGKTWNSALDRNTRPGHFANHRHTIPLDENFEVTAPSGGIQEMKFPGDTSLGATVDNVANCRCRITAQVE